MQLRNIVNATKMVAMSENGPIPNVENCWKDGAMWSWFMSWSTLVDQQNTPTHIKEVYADSKVKTVENS